MDRSKLPFHKRTLVKILLPVVLIGLLTSTLIVSHLSAPLEKFLIQQFDANLSLASVMGFRVCDDSFNYLLDLRLEANTEMNTVLKREAIDKIRAIAKQFPYIHLMVVHGSKDIELCTVNVKKDGIKIPKLKDGPESLYFALGGRSVRANVNYFPFWDWHIVSFVYEDDYKKPVDLAYSITYLCATIVFCAMLAALLTVYAIFINRPLDSLIRATDEAAGGHLAPIGGIESNEFGLLKVSFNKMVESLLKERAEVRNLIQQLRDSEALFRSQFEFGNIGIAIIKPERELLRANPKICQMLGYSEDELRDIPWDKLFHLDDFEPVMNEYGTILSGERDNLELDCRMLSKDGKRLFVHINASCLRDEDGVIKLVIPSFLDLTKSEEAREEKEKLELQLIQSQKLEAVGQLAGGVAHDLNNLLSPILGFSELLLEEVGEKSPYRENLEQIKKASFGARDIVRQLLAFSRKQALEYKTIDLNDTLRAFTKLLRRTIREDIEIVINKGENLAAIHADIGQVEQVIMNLSINAADAMPNGGKLVISTEMAKLDKEYARSHDGVIPGEYVMLSVSDTGKGMDEETILKIFEPFFSTKGELGTGLGLATVYGIVKQHQGNIWAYSELGQGSTFKVYFPRVEGAKEEKSSEKNSSSLEGTETVLVAEDNQAVRELSNVALKRFGYDVLIASNGAEALSLFKSHQGAIDLLITDVVMPGMNGKELYESLCEDEPNLRVLYMSGYTDNLIVHHGVLDDDVEFIQKPFAITTFAEKVREVLDKSHS